MLWVVKLHHISTFLALLQSNSGLWIDDVRLSVCPSVRLSVIHIWLTFVFKIQQPQRFLVNLVKKCGKSQVQKWIWSYLSLARALRNVNTFINMLHVWGGGQGKREGEKRVREGGEEGEGGGRRGGGRREKRGREEGEEGAGGGRGEEEREGGGKGKFLRARSVRRSRREEGDEGTGGGR